MNCSRDRESFSRSFGRTVSSFPTLLSQRIGTPGSPYCSRIFSGYVRVMQNPFTAPASVRRNSWYDIAGVSSFTRYVDDLWRSGSGFALGGSWISTRSVVAGFAPFAASLRLVPQLGQLIASGGTIASQNGQFRDFGFSGLADVTETFTAGGASAAGGGSVASTNRCPHCRHATVPGAAGDRHSGHSIAAGAEGADGAGAGGGSVAMEAPRGSPQRGQVFARSGTSAPHVGQSPGSPRGPASKCSRIRLTSVASIPSTRARSSLVACWRAADVLYPASASAIAFRSVMWGIFVNSETASAIRIGVIPIVIVSPSMFHSTTYSSVTASSPITRERERVSAAMYGFQGSRSFANSFRTRTAVLM